MNQAEKDAAVLSLLAQVEQVVSTPVDPPPWTPPKPDGTADYTTDYAVGYIPPWAGLEADAGCGVAPVARDHPLYPAVRAFAAPGGHRAEMSGFGTAQAFRRMGPGRRVYFGQSILWPANFPKTQIGWHFNGQLHTTKRGTAGDKQSAVRLSAANDTLRLSSYPNGALPVAAHAEPLRRDVWLHVVQHFEIGVNGTWAAWVRWDDEHEYRLVIPTTALDILVDSADWAYLKAGVYRATANRDTVEVFHRLAAVGSTFEAVVR